MKNDCVDLESVHKQKVSRGLKKKNQSNKKVKDINNLSTSPAKTMLIMCMTLRVQSFSIFGRNRKGHLLKNCFPCDSHPSSSARTSSSPSPPFDKFKHNQPFHHHSLSFFLFVKPAITFEQTSPLRGTNTSN